MRCAQVKIVKRKCVERRKYSTFTRPKYFEHFLLVTLTCAPSYQWKEVEPFVAEFILVRAPLEFLLRATHLRVITSYIYDHNDHTVHVDCPPNDDIG